MCVTQKESYDELHGCGVEAEDVGKNILRDVRAVLVVAGG